MPRRLVLAIGLGCALSSACDAPQPTSGRHPAPLSLHGAVVIEPPHLTVGDVATVDITVVTPPDHRVRPVRPPREVPGFWLLDSELLPVARGDSRWVHRTRIRARAREPGEFSWPAQRVEVETPEQEVVEVALPARPLRVASVADRFPQRTTPFSLRPVPEERDGAFLAPLAAGAVLALGAVALLAGLRRLRARPQHAEAPSGQTAPATSGWRAARATLEAARAAADASPARAADAGSVALRHFFSQRFAVSARTLTTEELLELEPPLAAGQHWPELLEILVALDAVRFRSGSERVETVRDALERASRLVAEAAPEARWR